eukprot:jgi/Ulvmu1/5547/UM023_0083.1
MSTRGVSATSEDIDRTSATADDEEGHGILPFEDYYDTSEHGPGVFFTPPPGVSRPCNSNGTRCGQPAPVAQETPSSSTPDQSFSFGGDQPVPLAVAIVLIVVPVLLAAVCLSCCCICAAQWRRDAENRRTRAEMATTRFLAAMAAQGTPLPPSTGRSDSLGPPAAGIPFLCLNPDDTFALGLLELPCVPRSPYVHSHADLGPPDSAPLSTHLSVDFRRDVIHEHSEASSPRSPPAAAAAAMVGSPYGGIGTHGQPQLHAPPPSHPLSHVSSVLHPTVNSLDGDLAPQPLSPVPGTATPPASIGPPNTELSLFSTHPRSFAAAAAASAFSLHSNGSSRFSDIRWPMTTHSMAAEGEIPDGAITIHQNPYAFMLDRGVMDPTQWSGGMGGGSMWSRGSVAARGGRFNLGSILSSRGGRRVDRGNTMSRDFAEWAALDVPCYRVELPADFQGWLAGGAASTLAGAASAATFWGGRLRSTQSVGSGAASGGSERGGGGSSFWQRISFTGALARRRSNGSGDHPDLIQRQGSGRSVGGMSGITGMRSYINALAEPHAVVISDAGSLHGRRALSLGSSGLLPMRHGLLSREAAEHSRQNMSGYVGAYASRSRRGAGMPRSARGAPDSGGNFWGLPAWPEGSGRPMPVDMPHGDMSASAQLDGGGAAPTVLLVEDLGEYTGSINIARQEDVGDAPSLWTGPPRVVEPGQAAGVAVPWGDLMLPSQGMHVVDSRSAAGSRPPPPPPVAPPPVAGGSAAVLTAADRAVATAATEAEEAQSMLQSLPSRARGSTESPSYWALMGGGFMDGVGSPHRFFERDDTIAEGPWQAGPGYAPAEDHLKTVYEDAVSCDMPLDWTEGTDGTQASVTIELTSFPVT